METKKDSKLPVRTCRVCRCTDPEPCRGGCAWVDDKPDLCTTCYLMIDALAEWYMNAHWPSFAQLRHELETVIATMALLEDPTRRSHVRP